jgi:hypothetical protein
LCEAFAECAASVKSRSENAGTAGIGAVPPFFEVLELAFSYIRKENLLKMPMSSFNNRKASIGLIFNI